jgi:hypothetical protein
MVYASRAHGNDIRLAERSAPPSSSLSTSPWNRNDARNHHIFRSTRDDTSPRHSVDKVEYRESVTLLIIRLLSYYKIQIFPADTHINRYDKTPLGTGSTFHVDASTLPVWSAKAHFRYRDPTFLRQGERFYFTDHTQTKWSHTTLGAYKTLVYESDADRDRD